MKNWQDVNILHKNRLKSRSFFIPYNNNAAPDNCMELQKSDKILLLNGEWQFDYYKTFFDYEKNLPNKSAKITVPSCWQSTGFEKPFYLNQSFQFPAILPRVPETNPVGVYTKNFELHKSDVTILSFLGVISSFDVYVNGNYIGYSEGSHNSSEFDITCATKNGVNSITVVVYKWCNGSYLECQDMFRNNGIFRDVYITNENKSYIYDIEIKSVKQNDEYILFIKPEIINSNGCNIIVEIYDFHNLLIEKTNSLAISLKNIIEWNAEVPTLYKIKITLIKNDKELEYIYFDYGFKTVEIINGIFLINKQPIKIKGINRHDTSIKNGCAVTNDEMLNDVIVMKKLNINAVRCSHYPPHPYFLSLCDKYGLYVINEADIECHGTEFMYEGKNCISESQLFENMFLDRVSRMYERDKNVTSIIMWSIGNESGCKRNQLKCYDYFVSKSTLPVHYEGMNLDEKMKGLDVISYMYPSFDEFDRCSKYAYENKKPLFLCEYGHSMGVGPGGLKEYWDKIYSSNVNMGGCIWEWCDHVASIDNKLTYGGDNGEYIHDNNFCVDGIVYPDRTLSPSAYEIAAVYNAIRLENNQNNLQIINTLYFKTLEYDCKITYRVGERVVGAQALKISLAPQEKKSIVLLYDCEYVDIEYINENNEKVSLQAVFKKPILSFTPKIVAFDYEICENIIELKSEYGKVKFDRQRGTITSIAKNGSEYLNQNPLNDGYNNWDNAIIGFRPNLYRYNIDNDMYLDKKWKSKLLDNLWVDIERTEYKIQENSILITTFGNITPPKFSKMFDFQAHYEIFGNLDIIITYEINSLIDEFISLPRFGMVFELDKAFDRVKWLGYGENENYSDFLLSNKIGEYDKNIDELCSNYIKPQEGGNRSGVRWCEFVSPNKTFKVFALDDTFNFNARHFLAKDFSEIRHREDLVKKETTEINIDGFFMGVGSNSCGPIPSEKYLLNSSKLKFSVIITVG